MKDWKAKTESITEPYIVNNLFVSDERGYFRKCYIKKKFEEVGIDFDCSEIFFSFSKCGVIRGMHFQTNKPQGKFVTIVKGTVYDVVIDLRRDSKTFGQWHSFELSDQNHKGLYIPAGFAHGFQALEEENVMLYLCHGEYDKETDTGIRFDDREVGISWPQNDGIIVGKRDQELMSFEKFKQTIGGI